MIQLSKQYETNLIGDGRLLLNWGVHTLFTWSIMATCAALCVVQESANQRKSVNDKEKVSHAVNMTTDESKYLTNDTKY